MRLLPVETFTDFGPSNILSRPAATRTLRVPRDRRGIRRRLRVDCPAAPGVYGMVDRAGRLIYVGMSAKLRDRLLDYFSGSAAPHPATPRKEQRIGSRAIRLAWEPVPHEFLALLRELELIRRFQPDLNVRGRHRRPVGYIFLTSEPAARFRVGAQLPRECRYHWGPLALNGQLRRTVEHLNRHFKLADCPGRISMHFADQRELFPIMLRPGCLRGELDACLGPCAGLCSRREYSLQLAAARALLDGRSDAPLLQLRRAIDAAAANQQFELAARRRDVLSDFETLGERLGFQRERRFKSFIYPLNSGSRVIWVLVDSGLAVTARSAPTSAASAARWLARLDAHADSAAAPAATRPATDAWLISSWFKRRPEEIDRLLSLAAARDVCRRLRRDPSSGPYRRRRGQLHSRPGALQS